MQLTFSMLSRDEQDRVHRAALSVLDRVGLRIHHDPLRDALLAAGAPPGESSDAVRIPAGLVRDALAAVPRDWDLVDQFGQPLPAAGTPHFVARLLLPEVLDYGQTETRPPVIADVVNLCQLAADLPGASIVYKTDCQCSDLSRELNYLETVAAVYRNSTRPCLANPIDPAATRYWVELGEAATGEPIAARPIVRCGIPATSPFQIDADSAQSLIYLARKKAPIICMAMPISGISAPLTLAGTIVQHTAEVLGLITAAQVINPGAPVAFAGAPCTMNMSTGSIVMASPALAIFNNALTAMARYYDLPAYTGATYTDARMPGVQCGIEKALSTLVRMAAGGEIGMLGGDLRAATVISYEQLLIDYAVWEASRRIVAGIAVTTDTLAEDVIARVGHDGQFLTDDHTLKWLRQGEHVAGHLFDRGGSAQSMLELAHARVEEILARPWESPTPTAARERIDRYVREETRRIRTA